MGRRGERIRAFRAFAVLVALACLSAGLAPRALAQGLSAEELELLKSLPADQRAEILREYGAPPAPTEAQPAPEVSPPEAAVPRSLPESAVERRMAESGAAPAAAAPAVADTAASVVPGVKATFRQFLQAAHPPAIDTNLKQFGYELFAGVPTTFAPATDIPVSPDYLIGPGDEVVVQLYGKTNLTAPLTVDRDGVIQFPELGPMTVAGLTFNEMKDTIGREVENRMIGVSVSVSMGRLRSIRIFVLGEVFQPGSYTVSGLSTLTNALFAGGGVQKIGSLRKVQLKREGDTIREMDLYDLLLAGDTSADVRLMPGDVVFVPPVGPLVGVAGEVLRPAIYEMKGALTARGLIDLAGGLTPTAFTQLLQLERVENGVRVAYDLSLDDAERWQVRDGDLLKVFPILDLEERVVFLDGNVHRAGTRQYFDGMRLLDLVQSPEDLLPETYFAYGLIERENEVNREPEYVAFNLGRALLEHVEEANVPLAPRDHVYVFHRAHFREFPSVKVRGEVRTPDAYEFKKDMRVLDLVLAAGGLTRDAWLDEAELFRTDPTTQNVTKIRINVGRALDGDPEHNLLLQDLDELAVHSIWEFKQKEEVEILGEVNQPGRYPLFDGMKVSDLVFAGGNLKESAYRRVAELTRYEVVNGERRQLRHVLLDLEAVLAGNAEADIALAPYDRLLIRRISNWRGDEVVHVSGEVAFPGKYPVQEGEHLSDLIERFGGFLSDAYLPAAVFARVMVRDLQAEQLKRMADRLDADLARLSVPSQRGTTASDEAKRQAAREAAAQLLTELRSAQATGRMVIRLDEAKELRGTEHDLVLSDGDELFVPKKPDFVMVMGQVNNPTAFQFQPGKGTSFYIRIAGGKSRFGDLGNVYVVKADGSVNVRRGARIDPGDVIIVPEDLERFGGMRFLLDLSQILYQIGLAAASAHTIGVFK
jgi:polysaccharide export outer membrane protein